MNGIEVYLRQSGERLLLNIYVPKERIRDVLTQLKSGSFEDPNLPIAFEAQIQPDWHPQGDGHVRVQVSAINLTASD
ncbi:MAG TPA: hypothetical protein VGO52_04315 [Hyphomonadaceae bacterium]|jgi:hypothetical protein|nr:hypothetical protein [Hyphomonadaceae bacterium]